MSLKANWSMRVDPNWLLHCKEVARTHGLTLAALIKVAVAEKLERLGMPLPKHSR